MRAPLVASIASVLSLGWTGGFAQVPEDRELIDSLIGYLGVTEDHRESILAGRTVFSGMSDIEVRDEEIAAAGAFLIVEGTSAQELVDVFLDTDSFAAIHALAGIDTAATAVAAADGGDLFAAYELDPALSPTDVIASPAEYLNLSAAEAGRIAAIDARAADAAEELQRTIRTLLNERLAAYATAGLDGIDPYVRPGGDSVSPAEEIRGALEEMAAIRGPFERFRQGIGTPPVGATAGERRLHWVEKNANGRRVVALTDQSRFFDDESAFAAELHYYVSGAYDALLTIVGATPLRDGTLLFAISHTYTGQVTGLAAGVRHRVARKIVAEGLASHLERVRDRVQPSP